MTAETGSVGVQDEDGTVRRVVLDPAPPLGAFVRVEGRLEGERLVDATAEVVGLSGAPFPKAGGEWLRLQGEGARRAALLRARAAVLRAVRERFDAQGFVEVETPLAVPSPGLDLHLDAFEVVGGAAPRWLITSPEYQMKRLLAGGLPRIYQIARCFRRGEAGTPPRARVLDARVVPHLRRLEGGHGRHRGAGRPRRPGRARDHAHPGPRACRRRHAALGAASPCARPSRATPRHRRRRRAARRSAVLSRVGRGDRAPPGPRAPDLPDRVARLHGVPGAPRADRPERGGPLRGVRRGRRAVQRLRRAHRSGRATRAARGGPARRRALGLPVYPIDERFLAALEEGLPPSGATPSASTGSSCSCSASTTSTTWWPSPPHACDAPQRA